MLLLLPTRVCFAPPPVVFFVSYWLNMLLFLIPMAVSSRRSNWIADEVALSVLQWQQEKSTSVEMMKLLHYLPSLDILKKQLPLLFECRKRGKKGPFGKLSAIQYKI